MYIYKNGARCPCCGTQITGMSVEWLELFSQLCHAARLEKLDGLDLQIQDIDTDLLKPPDAGIYPPIKPVKSL